MVMDWMAGLSEHEVLYLLLTAAVSAFTTLLVLALSFHWMRVQAKRRSTSTKAYGELIAQFKVNQGKQVVSVLESDGRRYIHVTGDLTPNERTKVINYLKSEGFMP